jgi:lipoprotein NlpI
MKFFVVAVFVFAASVCQADDGSAALRQALQSESSKNASEKLVVELSRITREFPDFAPAYYHRGRELFRLGKVKESVADFDEFVRREPKAESSQWERGIAYYYAGEYAKGAKQFELYQTYHDQDVENSVWRYLCVAATDGVEKARKNMLPIERDARIPMMEIFDLYRGGKTVDDVFAAAEAGSPTGDEQNHRQFYANLYVGLWYDSQGMKDKAKPYIDRAAGRYRISHYMGDVARIHAMKWKEE